MTIKYHKIVALCKTLNLNKKKSIRIISQHLIDADRFKSGYEIPVILEEPLRKKFGCTDLNCLLPSSYSSYIDTEEEEGYINILAESLDNIGEIMEIGLLFRIIESKREDLDLDNLGKHWAGHLYGANPFYNKGGWDAKQIFDGILLI